MIHTKLFARSILTKRIPVKYNERLRNQRPTLVVSPDVSTSVKEIWIDNVLLLETFLVQFLPAPKPFRRKDALGWVWGFLIYLFVGSFDNPEQGGELFLSEYRCNQEQDLYVCIQRSECTHTA